MKLYDIQKDLLELLTAIENGDIPQEAIADTLESVEGDYNNKIDNIACYIKSLNAEADAIKAEAAILTERQKAKQNKADNLKQYIKFSMQTIGKSKVETARNKISLQATAASVHIADEAKFIEWAKANKDDLLDYKDPTIKKTAIKDYINLGNKIDGVSLEKGETIIIK